MAAARRSYSSGIALLVSAAAALTTLTSGCFSGSIGEPGSSCQSTRTYFLNEVWGPVMARTCVNCHAPGGTAGLQNARLQLLPASYPDFVEANLANLQQMAALQYTGNGRSLPLLLAKPLGLLSHGGGQVFQEGSREYNAVSGLIQRLNSGASIDACPDYGSSSTPTGVVLLDLRQTLRRAALDLIGRLPTGEETNRVIDNATFEAVIQEYMREEAFYERVRVGYNDVLLTDRYVTRDGCDQRALNMIDGNDFPNRGQYGGGAMGGLDCCGMDRDNPMCVERRDFMLRANNGIAREPINLIDHVIRTDRPFSEILTADYVMVNPQSARVYGIESEVQFNAGYGSTELAEGRIHYNRRLSTDRMNTMTEPVVLPHAGVLTTAAFLNRFPTTDTNRNRHRARVVQTVFLATDILRVGERPIDPTAVEALVQTPTMNYGPCVTCHRINDPIAGSFRGFFPRNNTQFAYNPHDMWYTDMAPPGYSGENMPGDYYPRALQWLAPRIVQDPRFVSSVVRFVFTMLTGRQPLTYPTDTMEPTYATRSASWIEQDRIFRSIGREFVRNNMNFRTVVLQMIESPLYRAVALTLPDDAQQAASDRASHGGLGTSRMLTPEVLNRRIRAIAGFDWLRDASRPMTSNPWLTSDFYFLYGGIDSDTIIRRPTDPSGVITNIGMRMAIEVACRATAHDFTRERAARRFFPEVDLMIVPESAGNAVPMSVEAIRRNIVHLHRTILDEELAPNDPEVDRTYGLFLETWREVTAPMAMGNLPGECYGNRDPVTGAMLPMANQITSDRSGAIRAWMAVLTYLFSDYRFLYQ